MKTPSSAPELAAVSDEVCAIATALPKNLRFGTMTWTYPGWIGPLYATGTSPKQLVSQALPAYARHPLFRAVEFERTFHARMSAADFATFAAQVPDDFRFSAKAHQDCTLPVLPRRGPNKRFLDASYAADQVVAPFVEGLGDKAGPLVFQFRPMTIDAPERFPERLHDFLRKLPRGPRYAVELRNPELLSDAYGEALVDSGALHCYAAWGTMPGVREQLSQLPEATRSTLVIRWLTRPGDSDDAASDRYDPFDKLVEPDEATRAALASVLAEAARDGRETYAIASNKAEGCAPLSAIALAKQVVEISSTRDSA
ncbi:MAG: DUF72 domain-containing protein [Deltaproteobacteria bacterium]|nr:DUF72 domain-containing protein [Deltaproteobacteria bacterium]